MTQLGPVTAPDARNDDTTLLPPVTDERSAVPTADRRPAPPRRADRVRRLLVALEWTRGRLFGLNEPVPVRPGTATARWLFGLSVAFYVVYQLLTRGRMILGGSMWAEMGTNYYPTAISDSLRTQLLTTDAGYIPLPQRLIGIVGHAFGLPASAFPYFFTGTALVLSGLLIGSICLPAFRPVIASDGLRFLLALALMAVPDFETRTFINFTYLSVVPIAFVTALALVGRDRPVPAWCWVIPVLMISKPGVLAVLPAMVVVGILVAGRFRRVMIASVLAAAVQMLRLVTSASGGGSLLQDSGAGPITKSYATAKYTTGLIGRILLGPGQDLGARPWMALGIAIVLLSVLAVLWLRSSATGLVLIGLSMVLFTMLLDCFTFSALFMTDMRMLPVPGFDRRYVVALIGVLFTVAGLIAALTDSPRVQGLVARLRPRWGWRRIRRGAAVAGTLAFAVWFVSADWMGYTANINQPLGLPVGDVSQWTEMAPVLASNEPIVCVPLDPFGWMYGRNCAVLTDRNATPAVFGWADPQQRVDGREAVTVTAPPVVGDAHLASLALMVRAPAGEARDVTAEALVTSADGSTTTLGASGHLGVGGGLLQFNQSPVVPIDHVRSVTLVFDAPVTVGSARSEDATKAIILWMGQPRA